MIGSTFTMGLDARVVSPYRTPQAGTTPPSGGQLGAGDRVSVQQGDHASPVPQFGGGDRAGDTAPPAPQLGAADPTPGQAQAGSARTWGRAASAVALALGLTVAGNAIAADALTPHVFVGAPTVSLDARIPSPVHRPSPLAVEIKDGVGFGLDGHSLVVGPDAPAGTTIVGHLGDGTFPQRDFTVEREGPTTKVNGYFPDQSYRLTREGHGALRISNARPDFRSVVSADGGRVDGPMAAQKYELRPIENGVIAQGLERTVVRQDADGVKISNPERALSFEITRTDNGLHIEGAHKFQSYDVTYTPHGFVIQGAFPDQHVEVTHP
jgi:hypothetical protein